MNIKEREEEREGKGREKAFKYLPTRVVDT